MGRTPGGMSVDEVRRLELELRTQPAKYSPTQWENKLEGLLRTAEAAHGNRPVPNPRSRKKPPAPDFGYWRDRDRSNKKENEKRMPGKLDFEWWRVYYSPEEFPRALMGLLPAWKRRVLVECVFKLAHVRAGQGFTFAVDWEAKTGGGKLNPQQERTWRASELNPTRHPMEPRPGDELLLRAVLAI